MAEQLDVDAVAARADAATAGPWEAYNGNEREYAPLWAIANDVFHNPNDYEDEASYIDVHIDGSYQGEADAEFIAHAREDVPALVAEVKRLRQELGQPDSTRLRTAVEAARKRLRDAADLGLPVDPGLVEARLASALRIDGTGPVCLHPKDRQVKQGFKDVCRDCGQAKDWGGAS